MGDSPKRFKSNANTADYYDADFTQEISTKMRVPQRISVIDPDTMKPIESIGEPMLNSNGLFMHVPDRILIGEGGKHVAGKNPLPEAKLERNFYEIPDQVQLSAPPRNIHMRDHTFPSLEDNLAKKVKFDEIPNLEEFEDEKQNNSLIESPSGEISRDDVSSLKKQLRDTRRRVAVLEAENRERQQREVAFCSVALFYFIVKGVIWMNRSW